MIEIQTFLPYADFKKSAECLDRLRLGNQRNEAMEIYLNVIRHKTGWIHHPAVKMWEGYLTALKMYYNCILSEWIKRGYRNSMEYFEIAEGVVEMPPFVGNEEFHASHRSNLLRKDYEFYSKYGWKESTDLKYIWVIE